MKKINVLFILPILAINHVLASTDPFATSNRSSFVRAHGLPAPNAAYLLAPGKSSHSLTQELSSQFVVDDTANEHLFLDGETSSTIYRWRYGFTPDWEIGLDIPWLRQSGGNLDGFVEDWHDWFSLPNGSRENYLQNQLRYQYHSPQEHVNFSQTNNNLGDIGLHLRHQLRQEADYSLAAQLRIDAPTGSLDDFTGSESWDIALGLNASNSGWLNTFGGVVHGGAGLMWFGSSALLSTINKGYAGYAHAAIAVPAWKGVIAKAQIELNTAMYDSELRTLGDLAAQITFGVAYPFGSHWLLDAAMSEDISPNTAPDFTLLLNVSYRP